MWKLPRHAHEAKSFRGPKIGRTQFVFATAILLSATLLLSSCANSGGSNNVSTVSAESIGVHVAPVSAQVAPGASLQFTATVSGTPNVAVTWTTTSGNISSTGLYTAAASGQEAVITATSTANPVYRGSAQVTLLNAGALTISSTSLPSTVTGVPYTTNLASSGGTPPYTWSLSAGSLPTGLSLTGAGMITGTALQVGTFPFTVKVTDSASHTASASLSAQVAASSNLNYSGYDGPAQLPLTYLQTTLADTPAPGPTVSVPAGGDLQSALNSAVCGETILLQAGAVFSGNFELPATSCDDNHWIILRTSTPDSSLPPEGTRINPCYAGVASLPERPAFTCPVVKNVMAQILFTGPGISGPISILPGASHYRLIGLEITRALPHAHIWDLVAPDPPSSAATATFTADHFVFDRVWVHGTATDETKAGIHLSGITNAAVVDSYFSDLHCISVHGSCVDSQAISGGEGDTPGGPYKIDNNFLESAGQSIMFGGGPGSTSPTDIEIRFNHFFKPSFWQPGAPGFVGGYTGDPFVVKNNLEFKNAVRVLVEGNLLEHVWGGFTQHGYSVLFTPVNQSGHCPQCQVTDITFRYNLISEVGGGISMGNCQDAAGALAAAGERYSIHDVLVENVSAAQYDANGNFALMVTASPEEPLNSVSMQHNTALPDLTGHVVSISDNNTPIAGFVFANNLFVTPLYPMWSAGGGTDNCATTDVPLTVVQNCFPGYVFTNNVFAGQLKQTSTSQWPAGQLFTSSISTVGFVDSAAENYALSSSSPYKGKGTDSLDIGADVAGLTSMIASVP